MKRILLCALLAVLVATLGCRQKQQQLNVFIWSEYLDPAVIKGFEKRFNCKVVLDYYEDPESMMAKLAAGGDALYDIVVPSNTTMPALIKRGLLAELQKQHIPNLANLDPQFVNPEFNPGNRFGAPYLWGTTGLYVRKSMGPYQESWATIFSETNAAKKFVLIDDPRSCIGAALRYLGNSVNSTTPAELTAARELLISTKSRALGFEGAVAGRNHVLQKSAAVAIVYSGDAVRGIEEDPDTEYFVPNEGSEMWLDCLSIPANAPHRELAEKFINYILEPRVSAACAEFGRAATPNEKGRAFVDPRLLSNPAIYPSQAVMRRLEYANDLGAHNQLYEELWTKLKAK